MTSVTFIIVTLSVTNDFVKIKVKNNHINLVLYVFSTIMFRNIMCNNHKRVAELMSDQLMFLHVKDYLEIRFLVTAGVVWVFQQVSTLDIL